MQLSTLFEGDNSVEWVDGDGDDCGSGSGSGIGFDDDVISSR